MKNTLHKIYTVVFVALLSCTIQAQDVETVTVPLTNPSAKGKLVVNIIEGSIYVEAYSGNEVLITAKSRASKSKYKNKSKQKSREGMRRIDDNGVSFSIEEADNRVKISSSPNNYVDFDIKVPTNFSVDLKTLNDSRIVVQGVNGEHEVSNTNGFIAMKDISGSVIADALNEGMEISFATIDTSATMMFSSLNGDVDISFPENLKADIYARSDNGNIYTDFDIKKNNKMKNITKTTKNGVYQVKKEKGISGSINGGGSDMTFKTLNGDILIRMNE